MKSTSSGLDGVIATHGGWSWAMISRKVTICIWKLANTSEGFRTIAKASDDTDRSDLIVDALLGLFKLLFLRAELHDEAALEVLYQKYWAQFDEPWWKVEIGRGHAARQRQDVLLFTWLTVRTETEVNLGHLYGEIRRYRLLRPAGFHSSVRLPLNYDRQFSVPNLRDCPSIPQHHLLTILLADECC